MPTPRSEGFTGSGCEWPPETSSALKTRLEFICRTLRPIQPQKVLDVGCGTGEHLTRYLAQQFSSCAVYGVDSDIESIGYARKTFAHIENLRFSTRVPEKMVFDSIVASEVLEHVENPYAFLRFHADKLRDHGTLIVTVPNGYGCSEIMAFLESIFSITGTRSALTRVREAVWNRPVPLRGVETLAVSPHINFFTFGRLLKMFSECGFSVARYQGRMFLHNFLCSSVLDRSERLARMNARLGQVLPARLVSDWMFALKPKREREDRPRAYSRNAYERVRRRLNEKRFGGARQALRCP